MKKEVVVKVPAKPAKPATTKTIVLISCDVCGNEIVKGNPYGPCCMCRREICYPCRHYSPEDQGDYPDKYCPLCYDLKFKKYLEQREKIRIDFEQAEEDLEDKIRQESLGALA